VDHYNNKQINKPTHGNVCLCTHTHTHTHIHTHSHTHTHTNIIHTTTPSPKTHIPLHHLVLALIEVVHRHESVRIGHRHERAHTIELDHLDHTLAPHGVGVVRYARKLDGTVVVVCVCVCVCGAGCVCTHMGG
jgi:hypothetical protein